MLEDGGSQTVMLAVAGDEEMGVSMQAAAVDVAEEAEVVRIEVLGSLPTVIDGRYLQAMSTPQCRHSRQV